MHRGLHKEVHGGLHTRVHGGLWIGLHREVCEEVCRRVQRGCPRGVDLLHTSQHVKLFHSLIFLQYSRTG